jgi:hypothetical protein
MHVFLWQIGTVIPIQSMITHYLYARLLGIVFDQWRKFTFSGGGAKPPKFPTKLSNFRQTPLFALEKASFRSKKRRESNNRRRESNVDGVNPTIRLG